MFQITAHPEDGSLRSSHTESRSGQAFDILHARLTRQHCACRLEFVGSRGQKSPRRKLTSVRGLMITLSSNVLSL